jgi:hypothetical protein
MQYLILLTILYIAIFNPDSSYYISTSLYYISSSTSYSIINLYSLNPISYHPYLYSHSTPISYYILYLHLLSHFINLISSIYICSISILYHIIIPLTSHSISLTPLLYPSSSTIIYYPPFYILIHSY